MVYWKRGMMGPRPIYRRNMLSNRGKQKESKKTFRSLSFLQIAEIEWKVLNGDFDGGKKWKEMTTKDIGRWGEDAALKFLLQNGFHLMTRNWFCGHKELDLVMEDSRGIHIVEVRTRKEKSLKDPLESIDFTKQRRVVVAADSFIKTLEVPKDVFFDVVAVVLGKDEEGLARIKSIELIENAFLPIGVKAI